MVKNSITLTNHANLPKYEFDKIIISGVGGSAISGDLLVDLLRDTFPLPIQVSREYHLPAYADQKTLVFCISYSGNTIETLSQFTEALENRCKIISITSGGKLEEWSQKLEQPYVKLPVNYPSRMAIPYLIIPMLIYLQNMDLIDFQKDIQESIELLYNVSYDMQLDSIAQSLLQKQIVVYTQCKLQALAKRMSTQFNENVKIPIRYAIFPELNHNEISIYENDLFDEAIAVIFLRDTGESEEIKTHINLTQQIIQKKVETFEIWPHGYSLLTRMFTLLRKIDYLSLKLAHLYNTNPMNVPMIDFFKEELKRMNKLEKLEKKIF